MMKKSRCVTSLLIDNVPVPPINEKFLIAHCRLKRDVVLQIQRVNTPSGQAEHALDHTRGPSTLLRAVKSRTNLCSTRWPRVIPLNLF